MSNNDDNIITPKDLHRKEKKGPSAGVIAIAIVVLLAVGGTAGFIYGASNAPPSSVQPANFVSLPTVSSSLKSSIDGKSHSIDIDITVEYATDKAAEESQDAVYEKVKEAISSLDYEELKKADGIDYIEQAVKDSLGEVADAENFSNIYVGNIAIDFPGAIDSNNSGRQTNTHEKLKGLFNNIK